METYHFSLKNELKSIVTLSSYAVFKIYAHWVVFIKNIDINIFGFVYTSSAEHWQKSL
jgi:hypothetical protein